MFTIPSPNQLPFRDIPGRSPSGTPWTEEEWEVFALEAISGFAFYHGGPELQIAGRSEDQEQLAILATKFERAGWIVYLEVEIQSPMTLPVVLTIAHSDDPDYKPG